MSKRKVPIVAIVGRANVGKSSLFNAIIGRREAIVADEAGTTRDNVTGKVLLESKDFWLVDTAGLKSPEDEFELTIQDQIKEASASADVILVVVEADVPITNDDREAATMALRSKKTVLLVVNKIERSRTKDLGHWQRLGIKQVLPISASQKRGISELLEELEKLLPPARMEHDAETSVALLGRPNVGKSSLFNALAKKQQALVNARSGTTRDVNRAHVRFRGESIELMDTAGIRRSGKIERGVERFSVLRALAAIEEADVCLLLMDVGELNVQLDQKIAGLISNAGKGLILVVSKWDSIEKDGRTKDNLARQISSHYQFIYWAPLIFTSAVTGQNVARIFDQVEQIAVARRQKFKSAEINNWLRRAVEQHLPAGLKNHHPKLHYIVQEEEQELPSFKIFGRHTKFLHTSYKRYLENSFRERWPLIGTPLRFWFIEDRKEVE